MDDEVTGGGDGVGGKGDGRTPPDSHAPTVSKAAMARSRTSSIIGVSGSLALGNRFGRYTIQRLIGTGGMGAVYEAKQDSPHRSVALKVIRSSYLSPQLMRRFEYESQVLGKLQHPGIAQVYEAGSVMDPNGGTVPFFAMELIQGVPLTDYATSKRLSTRERLELMARICDAVYHAHQKGVIHRDLKPGNILVDGSGQPKILDFGVARATDSDIQQTAMQTDIGQLIGTVPYMSPEQVGGDPDELDTRSDVYALGVIAYELLAGRLPYDLQKKMIHEAVRVIREDEPTRLSRIDRALRGDVETIVGTALEKDKARRYQSAEALGSDIRRYLKDEPIAARPASTWYQAAKFARRNKVLVGGIAATFLALAIGFTGVSLALKRALKAESDLTGQVDQTQKALQETTQVANFQAEVLGAVSAAAAGEWLTQDTIERFERVQAKRHLSSDELARQVNEFRSLLRQVNATDVATALIDRTLLKPSVEAIEERFKNQPLVAAHLRSALADRYGGIDRLDEALALRMKALDTYRSLLGEHHRDTIESQANVGLLLTRLGRIDEADGICREALAISKRTFGDAHPTTLVCANIRATLLQATKQFEDSEALFRSVLESRRKVLGELHPNTLQSINNLGSLLAASGKFAEAEALCIEGLEKTRAVSGAKHHNTLIAKANLASVLQQQQKFAEADMLYREVLAEQQAVFGEDNLTALRTLNVLGSMLWSLGRLDETEPLFRDSLAMNQRVFGDDHEQTITAMVNMAALLAQQNKLNEAEALDREVIARGTRVLGPDHATTLFARSNLAVLLQEQGQFGAAEVILKDVLDRRQRVLGADHSETLAALGNMGEILKLQGKLKEAEPYVRQALESKRRVLGDGHPSTLIAINNLGALLYAQGNPKDALPFIREGLVRTRDVLGADHEDTITSMNNLGALLRDLGEYDEAEVHCRDAVTHGRRALSDTHPTTMNAVRNLGALLFLQRHYKEAADLIAPVIDKARGTFIGGDTPRFGSMLVTLGRARVGMGYEAGSLPLAEANLLEANQILSVMTGVASKSTTNSVQGLVDLYTIWHAAEPDKGYDVKAAEWKAKLPSQDTPKVSP